MSRQIYLPELLSIGIKNYTLYPNGLDCSYDFVNGINLILGGNGMGKTTFVNIIKFALIGLYKKHLDYTRTYKDKAIVKRLLYSSDYFSARKDEGIRVEGEAIVTLRFRLCETSFEVTRSLDNGYLLSLYVDGEQKSGAIISEEKYEKLDAGKSDYLLYVYENEISQHSNLTFDDFIFFINEILFFGEDHRTVLWNDGVDGRYDVQNELFNKYFNEPHLDKARQEAQRQAKYYDSMSRHKSEDMRVVKKLIDKIETSGSSEKDGNESYDIINLKESLDKLKSQLVSINDSRNAYAQEVSLLHGEINRASLQVGEKDREKGEIEKAMNKKLWERLHPQYGIYVKNIQLNHICPMCNQPNVQLVERVAENATRCFVCGNEIHQSEDIELTNNYDKIISIHKSLYQSIVNKQKKVKLLETKLEELDRDYAQIELEIRTLQQKIREAEFQISMEEHPSNIQALYDEYEKNRKAKEEYQRKSNQSLEIEKRLTKQIEHEVMNNAQKFSTIFASFAGDFLGVPCSLTYDNFDGSSKRFYPVIDNKTRHYEESLSESQKFFVDHSFRMSILTFFYQKPTFYVVETPDSSLDISYEKNAADVFVKFLNNPNSVIITSNLNNSSFVEHLLENEHTHFSMVGLLDIAKESTIQSASEQLKLIYNKIKKRVRL